MLVYKITNKINGKIYIGKTQTSLEARWKQHLSTVAQGEGYYLHKSLRKHGVENFTVEVLDHAEAAWHLATMERAHIARLNSQDPNVGYNIAPGGEGGMSYSGARNPFYGKTHSPEARAKMAAANLGRKHSQETNEKRSKSLVGRTHGATFTRSHSPETIAKMKASHQKRLGGTT